jgi:CCR4-NOT transcription complex subunit 6
VIDGCAIFFKRTRFMLSERYGVEFNEAARQHFGTDKRKLRRLMKGNIGLVVVLEDIGSNRRVKRKLCVCNTHTYWDPEFADVKLWQTWILCKELEEFVCNRGLPLLLCGDFNSMKDSAVYELLSTERLHPNSPIFQKDTASILPQDYNEISHRLDLQSTYSCIGEPAYTNYTKQFKGVLDYIFFTKNNLVCTAVVDVDDEKLLKEHTALPSPHYPSDHISLVATLDWLVDPPNIRQSSGGYQPNKSRGYPRR